MTGGKWLALHGSYDLQRLRGFHAAAKPTKRNVDTKPEANKKRSGRSAGIHP
jgi:hypothetical protein